MVDRGRGLGHLEVAALAVAALAAAVALAALQVGWTHYLEAVVVVEALLHLSENLVPNHDFQRYLNKDSALGVGGSQPLHQSMKH